MKVLTILISVFIVSACSNLMDSDLTQRNTFIKIYNGVDGIEASGFESSENGYVIVGNTRNSIGITTALTFSVDHQGNRISDIQYYTEYPGFTAKNIKRLPGNQGYVLVGDILVRDQTQSISDNIDIYTAVILPIGNDLTAGTPVLRRDETADESVIKIDYKATSITTTPSSIVVLGNYRVNNSQPVRPYLRAYSPNLSTILWTQDFAQEERNHNSARSIHFNNGNLVWASGVTINQGGIDLSYITIPFVKEGSTFTNNSEFGLTTDSVEPRDIQPSNIPSIGFGIIGTKLTGANSNIIFLRADNSGTIIENSIAYFDAVLSASGQSISSSESQVQDFGTALTSTSDGGYALAGHFVKSDGRSDIVLIKLDAFGNSQWVKTLGGNGDETVSKIIETTNKGLLLCGTHTISEVSSIFLIKTDFNGELKN